DSEHSAELKDFLQQLLQKEPVRRKSAAEMKAHAWLEGLLQAKHLVDLAVWIADTDGNGSQGPEQSPAAAEPRAAAARPFDQADSRPALAMGQSVRGGANPFFCGGEASPGHLARGAPAASSSSACEPSRASSSAPGLGYGQASGAADGATAGLSPPCSGGATGSRPPQPPPGEAPEAMDGPCSSMGTSMRGGAANPFLRHPTAPTAPRIAGSTRARLPQRLGEPPERESG
ncbi:unnamed protein product, partial [Polarella glacialis]